MRFVSLEKKLPLLISGLVASALIITLTLVHFSLRQSAIEAADERLGVVTSQLAEIAEASVFARAGLVRRVAADPVITQLAATGEGDVDAAVARMRALANDSAADLAVGLWSRDGQLLAAWGLSQDVDETSPEQMYLSPPPLLDGDSVVAFTELSIQDDRVTYWISAPVIVNDRVAGRVAQQRAATQSSAGGVMEGIIGGSAEIFFANASGGAWTYLAGDAMSRSPVIPEIGRTFQLKDGAGDQYFAYAAVVSGTPWLVVVRVPYEAVLGQSASVMRRLILVSLVVLLLGGAGAWIVSRSVTAPLMRLGAAADIVATGDYSGRTGVRRHDEIGRLAASFDTMAAHVEAAHGELARRYEQSRHLASQLEQTNQRLTRANAEAEAARTEAQTANRVKSEFLATMSHEIRTPINAVVGYTGLLELGLHGALSDGQREYVQRIRLSSEHLISVVNDVLDFAKLESGQMRIQRRPGAAVDEIAAAIAMLQVDAAQKKASVSVDCRSSVRYLGDPQRVQQILLNLISNAIKFSGDGGRITVSCAQTNGEMRPRPVLQPCTCITVADNGPGIDESLQEAIFHPFVQSEGGYTRPYGGTGLGLAISRSLARMMSGDLTVQSAPGRGAAFTLRLPQPEHASG